MQGAPYTRVPLYRRDGSIVAHALVDDEDAPWALGVRWHVGSNGYARRHNRANPKAPFVMHRELMRLEYGDQRQVDHINRDKLDNRRANLRIVTHAENMQNRTSYKGSTSRFRAVWWDKSRRKWRAVVHVGNKEHWLGRFDDELSAAFAAEAFRREHLPFAEPDPALVEAIKSGNQQAA